MSTMAKKELYPIQEVAARFGALAELFPQTILVGSTTVTEFMSAFKIVEDEDYIEDNLEEE